MSLKKDHQGDSTGRAALTGGPDDGSHERGQVAGARVGGNVCGVPSAACGFYGYPGLYQEAAGT